MNWDTTTQYSLLWMAGKSTCIGFTTFLTSTSTCSTLYPLHYNYQTCIIEAACKFYRQRENSISWISSWPSLCFHRDLNDSYLEDELGIKYMADSDDDLYEANNRKLRKGQVGCFLSHHAIRKKVRESESIHFHLQNLFWPISNIRCIINMSECNILMDIEDHEVSHSMVVLCM